MWLWLTYSMQLQLSLLRELHSVMGSILNKLKTCVNQFAFALGTQISLSGGSRDASAPAFSQKAKARPAQIEISKKAAAAALVSCNSRVTYCALLSADGLKQ